MAQFGVRLAGAGQLGAVAEPPHDLDRPGGELGPAPLKAVVAMAQLPVRQGQDGRVPVSVGRGEHDGAGPGVTEHGLRQDGQACGLDVLHHLHQGGGIEAGKAAVAVGQRGLQQEKALALPVGQAVEAESLAGGVQRPRGDVGADDAGEAAVGQQQAEQPPLAAAQVEHAGRAAFLQHPQHGLVPEVVEAGRLLGLTWQWVGLGIRSRRLRVQGGQAAERLPRQPRLAPEVAPGDELAVRVGREPALAVAEQLVDLVL